jgi:hypothetical protein
MTVTLVPGATLPPPLVLPPVGGFDDVVIVTFGGGINAKFATSTRLADAVNV